MSGTVRGASVHDNGPLPLQRAHTLMEEGQEPTTTSITVCSPTVISVIKKSKKELGGLP